MGCLVNKYTVGHTAFLNRFTNDICVLGLQPVFVDKDEGMVLE